MPEFFLHSSPCFLIASQVLKQPIPANNEIMQQVPENKDVTRRLFDFLYTAVLNAIDPMRLFHQRGLVRNGNNCHSAS